MTTSTSNLIKLSLAAPLALALAACGGETGEATSGGVIEPIAAPDGTAWVDTVTISDADGYILGNPDAPLKLVEYASHTCGACANFSQTAKPSIKEYVATGVVSFEQRNLVRDPIDLTIATLVRCGPKENMQTLSDMAWEDFATPIMAAQSNPQAMQQANSLPLDQKFVAMAEITGLIEFFAARGLSADQQRACLADAENIERIAQNSTEQSRELGINSTPTFLLNGNKVDALSWADLEPILQDRGARPQ